MISPARPSPLCVPLAVLLFASVACIGPLRLIADERTVDLEQTLRRVGMAEAARRDTLAVAPAVELVRRDPERAVASLAFLMQAGGAFSLARDAIYTAWVDADAKGQWRFVVAHLPQVAGPELTILADYFHRRVEELARRDIDRAIGIIADIPTATLRAAGYEVLVANARHPAEFARLRTVVRDFATNPAAVPVVRELAVSSLPLDPPATLRWVLSLRAGAARTLAIDTVFQRLGEAYSTLGLLWFNTAPERHDLAAAVDQWSEADYIDEVDAAFVRGLLLNCKDPERVIGTVQRVTDPQFRPGLVHEIVRQLRQVDPDASLHARSMLEDHS